MRKSIFALSMIAFTVVGLSACSKCEVCTRDASNEIRVCESDYSSNTAYGLALDFQETQGYNCR